MWGEVDELLQKSRSLSSFLLLLLLLVRENNVGSRHVLRQKMCVQCEFAARCGAVISYMARFCVTFTKCSGTAVAMHSGGFKGKDVARGLIELDYMIVYMLFIVNGRCGVGWKDGEIKKKYEQVVIHHVFDKIFLVTFAIVLKNMLINT